MIPSTDKIEEKVEEQEKFLKWLVEIWHSKGWVRKLLLIEALFTAFLNPIVISIILQHFNQKTPTWYVTVWWITASVLFMAALILAIRSTPRTLHITSIEHRAIKGLRPFVFSDAEIFARLQREESLRECLSTITDNNFRFGILCGESGSGKTSFLQAGLWPNVLIQKHRCLYVKFTDLDPLTSIRQVFSEYLNKSRETLENKGLVELIEGSFEGNFTPLVLLFDQFEQFFVHHKRRIQRKAFIQELARWYQKKSPLPVKLVICIRGDFNDHLIELQKAMGYSLGPHESFRLEKFEPKEAAAIFRVIAETEGLICDEGFVEEVTTQELASREDGLISPVDIQILAWMIVGQQGAERAFNRTVYQKLGGVEGLLERFLKRALGARETELRRQAAIKVLLVLTDLEKNSRAGVFTLNEIKERLQETVSANEVEETVEWLARGDVRLITPSEEDDIQVYELAHERLIPALRRLAGQELSDVDRANQLLDRRANEWMGNNSATRYLLTWRELRLIERHRPYLVWKPRKHQKEIFIAKSKRRLYVKAVVFSLPVIFAIGYLSLMLWQNTPSGRIRQVSNTLLELSSKSSRAAYNAALASAANEEFDQANQIARQLNSYDKSLYLHSLVTVYIKLGEAKKDPLLLEQAQDLVHGSESLDEASNLRRIAEAYSRIGHPLKATEILAQALTRAQHRPLNGETLSNIADIAESYAKYGETQKASDLLNGAHIAANQIPFADGKILGLKAVAVAYANIGGDKKDNSFLDEARSITRSERELSISTGTSEAESAKISALLALAEAFVKMGNSEKAIDLLKQAETITATDNELNAKYVEGLASLAETYAKVGNMSKASELLSNLKPSQVKALTFVRIGETENNISFVSEAAIIGDNLDFPQKAEVLLNVARAYAKLGKNDESSILLEQLSQQLEKESRLNTELLPFLVEAYAQAGDWRSAHHTAAKIIDGEIKVKALSILLISWAKNKNPILAEINWYETPVIDY